MERYISLLGFFVFVALAWCLSDNRRKIRYRTLVVGVAVQFGLAAFIFLTPLGESLRNSGKLGIESLNDCAAKGAISVFGTDIYSTKSLLCTALPVIIFFSALTAVLFHLGVLQWVTRVGAWLMARLLGTSGSESVCTTANIFVGMNTAPLMIRPYLGTMTRSELMLLMVGGLATSAGGTMAAYSMTFGVNAGHLVVASILSAPAAIVVAKLMIPETEESPTYGKVKVEVRRESVGVIDAACRGASEGMKIAITVAAMLIAFVSLVALMNLILGWIGTVGGEPLTWQRILGWLFSPFAWLLGVPPQDVSSVGYLLGEKTVTNEFIAYGSLQSMMPGAAETGTLSARSVVICTYALCGFANFGSIAVMIGGISTLIPERRADLARLGIRSLIGGVLVTLMTAALAGVFL